MDLPLNALRAFEVSARHLSFTRAAEELCLTQTAVSQHVRKLVKCVRPSDRAQNARVERAGEG